MKNLFEYERELTARTDRDVAAFIAGGADDEKTIVANRSAFDRVRIRARIASAAASTSGCR